MMAEAVDLFWQFRADRPLGGRALKRVSQRIHITSKLPHGAQVPTRNRNRRSRRKATRALALARVHDQDARDQIAELAGGTAHDASEWFGMTHAERKAWHVWCRSRRSAEAFASRIDDDVRRLEEQTLCLVPHLPDIECRCAELRARGLENLGIAELFELLEFESDLALAPAM